MATLIRRKRPKDTIKKFETVAELKYQDSLLLIDAGKYHTGMEQLGYATEMFLKSIYFRSVRVRLGLARTTSEITNAHLLDAKKEGLRLGVPYDPESYHSPLFWAALIIETRKDLGRALQPDIEHDLLRRIKQLYGLWMIEYRYQPIPYQFSDVLQTRGNVTWLRNQHRNLWR